MSKKTYFDPEDLKKFGNITEFQEEYGKKFFQLVRSSFRRRCPYPKREIPDCAGRGTHCTVSLIALMPTLVIV